MRDGILSAVASYREETARFISELVSIPTENPPGLFYRDCAEAIGRKLGELDLDYRIHEIPATKLSENETGPRHPRFWLESSYGEGSEVLYFHGHYDVVPAQRNEQFRPTLQGDRLYGRGAADMKGGIAVMIDAIRALRDCGIPLDGRIGLTVVPDEETGGGLGSRYLTNAGLLGRDGVGMLTAEPTGGVAWNASRGAVSLLVTVMGRAAHVGLQRQGTNAFEKALEVGRALLELKKEVENRRTFFRIDPEEARHSILMMGGRVEGGDTYNLVPSAFSFSVDRRINPEESLDAEKKRIFDVLDAVRAKGVEIGVETIQEGLSAGCSEESRLGRALAESVEQVTGRPARFELCPGLLEIRFYAEKSIPALACGPGLLSVAHGPDEYVGMSDVGAATAVYALTAARLLSRP